MHDPFLQRDNSRVCCGKEGSGHFGQHGRIEHRFITLDIHNHVGIHIPNHFGDAVGAGSMVRAGHDGFAAETLDR